MNDIIPSLGVHHNPQFAVITDSRKWGFGIFSWHIDKADADHNAKITKGVVVPVDYHNGELIVPPLVNKALKNFLKELP